MPTEPRAKGLSLIELLVVVAIVVLLVSILIPSLSQARKITLRMICASNFHQLHVGTIILAPTAETKWPRPTGPIKTVYLLLMISMLPVSS